MLLFNCYYSATLIASALAEHGLASTAQRIVLSEGCSDIPLNSSSVGFQAQFYDTPFNSSREIDKYLILDGRKLTGPGTSASNITDLSLHGHLSDDSIVFGEVYGVNTTVSNFTVELSGYYKAPQTGVYQISLNDVTPGVVMRIGSRLGNHTCTGDINVDGRLPLAAYNVPSAHDDLVTTSEMTKYEAGKYYPIRIVFTNLQSYYNFNLTITLPDGKIQTNFENVISLGSISDEKQERVMIEPAKLTNFIEEKIQNQPPNPTISEATTTLQPGQQARASWLSEIEPYVDPLTPCSSVDFPLETGLHANFYHYPFGDKKLFNFDAPWPFWLGGYNSTGLVAQADGVIDDLLDKEYPLWWSNPPTNAHIYPGAKGVAYGDVYGQNITYTNFTVELSGYYRAPMTGAYNFSILYVYPGILLRLGANSDMVCVGDPKADVSSSRSDLIYGINGGSPYANYYHLEEGQYYPITIVFSTGPAFGWNSYFEVDRPDGFLQTDLTDFYSVKTKVIGASTSSG